MSSLYKCLIAVFLTSLSLGAAAQDLAQKIPSDALAVATIKGKNLMELMSLTEFNNSFIGKKVLSKISKKAGKPYTSVEDIGFNLASSFYYYNLSNDSVTYNCFLAPVKNAAQLDAFLTDENQKVSIKDGVRSYYNADSTEVAHWNDQMFLFIAGSGKKEHFDVIQDSTMTVEVPEVAAVDTVMLDSAVTTVAQPEETIVNSPSALDEDLKNGQETKSIVAGYIQHMAEDFFTASHPTSILNNSDFVKSMDPQAQATFWIAGVDKLFNAYMPVSYFKGMSFLSGYGSGSAKFYLEDKSIRLTTSMTLSNEVAAVFKRIHQRKLNERFLKYVNEDRMIGYIGYALDTRAYLEEYPKLISKIYGSVYAEEIGMAADLFSLLLDEEAISKVVKGDALLIFNGLSQSEVSYKSYEYNEDNFETKEVMKTRKETLPDFLLMISSEDTRLIDKLIAYGEKKGLVKKDSGYYEISIPESPIALYFTIKDNIIFLGTGKTDMDNIAGNRYVAKVSARQKKNLLNSNYAAYFNAKKLSGKIPAEELGGAKKLEKINRMLNTMGDIYLKSNPINGNVFSGQLSMDIPANQPNALKYLFSIVEDAKK